MRYILIFLIIFLMLPIVEGAQISGNVYDYSLNPMNDVVLTINSNPKQQYISKDGAYKFLIPTGNYTLTAKYIKNNRLVYFTEEEINITEEGYLNS